MAAAFFGCKSFDDRSNTLGADQAQNGFDQQDADLFFSQRCLVEDENCSFQQVWNTITDPSSRDNIKPINQDIRVIKGLSPLVEGKNLLSEVSVSYTHLTLPTIYSV